MRGLGHLYTVKGKELLLRMLIPWYFWAAAHVDRLGSDGQSKPLGKEMQALAVGSPARIRVRGCGWGTNSICCTLLIFSLIERFLRKAFSSLFLFLGQNIITKLKDICMPSPYS